jgi:tRNA(fMet)-specific endonuclease VapC
VEPAGVAGVILDSSVIIGAERREQTVRQILEQVRVSQGEIEIGVSVVTIAELVHGAYRAKTPARQEQRLEFIERLSSDVPVHPVSLDIARLAGRIEGQEEAKGIQFAFEDLLIGATALYLDYAVATLNLRDFQRVPGLSVVQL